MRKCRNLNVCAFLVLAVGCISVLFAQAGPTLHRTDAVSVNEEASLTVFPIKSDRDGNIYIRLYETGNLRGGPILKISADGKKTVRFSLSGQKDVGGIQDFSPGPDGELFLLTRNKDQTFILRYSSDGHLDGTESVENGQATLNQIAVFSSSEFLLGGKEELPAKEVSNALVEKHSLPFWGIFNPSGQLLKKLTPTVDHGESKEAEDSGKRPGPMNAEPADDGNVYATRYGGLPQVQVISPSGAIRTVSLDVPKGVRLTSIKVAKGRIAAMFTEPKGENSVELSRIFFRIYDTGSGKQLAQYQASVSDFGLGLATYEPDVFTFLGADEKGKMQLQRGSPH